MPLFLPHLSTGQLTTAAHWNNVTDAVNTRLQIADLIALTAFGGHTLFGTGVGGHGLQIKNLSAGAGNYTTCNVRNDVNLSIDIVMLASNYTPSGYLFAGGGILRCDGPGGLTLASLDTGGGHIRFYTGQNPGIERMRLHKDGQLVLTGAFTFEGSGYMAGSGLVINQATSVNEIVCLKAEDIAHGMTSITDTNTYGAFSKSAIFDGGLKIRGMSESVVGLDLIGNIVNENTTSMSAASAAVTITAGKKSGSGLTALGATANLFAVLNEGALARWIVKGNGDVYRDGTDNLYDAHDDAKLALAWEHSMSPSERVTELFNQWCGDGYGTDRLIELGILAERDPDTGRHFYNESALLRLVTGAIWQLGIKVQALEQEVADRG